jgi:hypothetical protein
MNQKTRKQRRNTIRRRNNNKQRQRKTRVKGGMMLRRIRRIKNSSNYNRLGNEENDRRAHYNDANNEAEIIRRARIEAERKAEEARRIAEEARRIAEEARRIEHGFSQFQNNNSSPTFKDFNFTTGPVNNPYSTYLGHGLNNLKPYNSNNMKKFQRTSEINAAFPRVLGK